MGDDIVINIPNCTLLSEHQIPVGNIHLTYIFSYTKMLLLEHVILDTLKVILIILLLYFILSFFENKLAKKFEQSKKFYQEGKLILML